MTKDEQHAYRSEVVELFRESGMSQKAFAESYGIARSTLGIWIKEIQNDAIETRTSCVSVGAIGRQKEYRQIRITTSNSVTVEVDLPATEEEIVMILRAVAAI